jgi:hypothetical protein
MSLFRAERHGGGIVEEAADADERGFCAGNLPIAFLAP